jgi:hypothetical protein
MGQRAVILVTSDTATDTVAQPATLYEVDLDAGPGKAVRATLREYLRRISHGTEFLPDDQTPAAVRSWARSHALPVGSTGRLPDEVQDRFNQDRGPTVADAISDAAQEQDAEGVTHLAGRQSKTTKRPGKKN